jgi:cytochrome c5
MAADGKAVYDKTCVAVPRQPAWPTRPSSATRRPGRRVRPPASDALLASVVKGKGAMPPKAGAADLKDDDIKAAIDYMLAAAK